MHEAVLDGEIVAFDDNGRPSFERLQRRMHVTSPNAVRRLCGSHAGRLRDLRPALPRRPLADGAALHGAARAARGARARRPRLARARRASATHGKRLLEATASQGLEGVVAKRLDSRYEPGRRTGAWLKIKHTQRQELVIGGWIPGEGRRARADRGAADGLLTATARSCYAGRVGTGFTEKTLDELRGRLEPLRRDDLAVRIRAEAAARGGVRRAVRWWPRSSFASGRTRGCMRAPSFKGLREDKSPREVVAARDRRRATPGRRRRRPELSGGAVRRGRASCPRASLAVLTRGAEAEDHQLGQGAVPRDRASPRAT